uniref:hypothetical protein n=1 Tax=Bacillus altitudinis TaxID=293387 RepID=UPI0011A2C9FB
MIKIGIEVDDMEGNGLVDDMELWAGDGCGEDVGNGGMKGKGGIFRGWVLFGYLEGMIVGKRKIEKRVMVEHETLG